MERVFASRPQRTGRSTTRRKLAKVLARLERIQKDFNKAHTDGKAVSLADLVVLGGAAAVEQAAKAAGQNVAGPLYARTDGRITRTD